QGQIDVTDADVNSYFDSNRQQYRTQEKASIQYVQFKPEDFSRDVQVTEEDLTAEYEHYVATSGEQERRRSSHILVEVNDDRDEEEAKARITEARAKLEAGEDFAAVAKAYSDDAASAEQGGDLDFAARGVYDAAFEKALFELQEGKVSDIVRSEFGFHLIKLTGVEKPAIASLDAKKEELKQQLVQSKAAEKLNEAIDELNRLAYESGDLATISEQFGKKVEETPLFTRQGGSGIAADKKVIEAAFSDAVLKDGANSEAIELADGSVLVLRIGKHEPARDQTLEEVKDQVVATLKQQKARDKAAATADEIVARLQKGESLEALGDAFGLVWSNAADVNRQNAEVPRPVVTKLFEMPRPPEGGRVVDKAGQPNGDQDILVLTRVKDGEFKFSEDEIVQNSLAGAARFGQVEFENYMGILKQGAEIVQH
ncbi:MAG: peptidylprolyl isomerase, partial [Pseudomonadota bacterium]